MPKKRKGFRIEKDSLGEVYVPNSALYGAQTQRAIDNFPISTSQVEEDENPLKAHTFKPLVAKKEASNG